MAWASGFTYLEFDKLIGLVGTFNPLIPSVLGSNPKRSIYTFYNLIDFNNLPFFENINRQRRPWLAQFLMFISYQSVGAAIGWDTKN